MPSHAKPIATAATLGASVLMLSCATTSGPRNTGSPPPVLSEAARDTAGAQDGLSGLTIDYPEYYAGIIRAIGACWEQPPSPPEGAIAKVRFELQRDGTISEVRLDAASGDDDFDQSVLRSIECAGDGRVGPLPEAFPYDALPIVFEFRPRRSRAAS